MTGSEFAFLALGLLLGSACGAAVVFVYRSRPPSREVRVTVTHDAVPRRASTLSSEALVARPGEPAPGGPGDRRQTDSGVDPGATDRRHRAVAASVVGAPAAAADGAATRTAVRSEARTAVRIQPEPDALLASIRAGHAGRPLVARILRGDHAAMLAALDAIAGDDGPNRRTWESLLSRLVAALDERAIDLGYLDFPLGAPFWDTFTVDQCRRLVAMLGVMGFRFDGRDGWQDGRAPSYRDLSTAVAEIGYDPRRIRAWPNHLEIGELFRGVRPAPEAAIDALAPGLESRAIRDLLGPRAGVFEELSSIWEPVRRILTEREVPAPIA